MVKSIKLTIETQTQDEEVLSLCFINQNTIAFETSDVAKKMFKLNKTLFNKINSSTKLIGGALYRQEVISKKEGTNRLLVPLYGSYDYKEKEISQLFFKDNMLKKQQRALTKNGTKVDYNPDEVPDLKGNGIFDAENLTQDDLLDMRKICTIEEISLFEDIGVKTLLITDDLKHSKSVLRVGYRIDVTVDTNFKEYVEFILKNLDESIKFLTQYLYNIHSSSEYDLINLKFRDSFSKSVLGNLGITGDIEKINLSNSNVKNSKFGQAALNYYNGLLTLSENVEKSVYGEVLKSVLPTSKSSPESISSVIQDMSRLYRDINSHYSMSQKSSMNKIGLSKMSNPGQNNNTISTTSMDLFQLEKEKLGYSLFSNAQKGLNKFSSADYKNRYVAEQAKYYPRIQVDDSTGILTPSERASFSRIDNAPSFLTPAGLVMGDKTISTNRGIINMIPDEVRSFRLAKSSRAESNNTESFPSGNSRARIGGDVMSKFNITIGKPHLPILSRATEQNLDPLIDAKKYLGDQSSFSTTNTFQLIRSFKRIMSREDKRILSIVSDIVPRRFLRDSKAVKSVKELQLAHPKSRTRALTVTQSINYSEIPPHVKFMMTSAFAPNPDSDPLKNSESREIIEETQKNLFVIRALTGFGKDELGIVDINIPIYKNIDSQTLASGRPVLGKASHYEIPELGIVKDKFAATIYSNLIYIRG